MTFDKKAWEEANKEKVLLYAQRNRLKRKGIDPDVAAPLPTLTPEQKAAKRAEARARLLASKRVYDATHREEKARRFRERYENDPDFRARQHEKRRQYYWANKKVLSDEEKADRYRRRQEALAKARRVYAAQRRAEGEARLAEKKQRDTDLERATKAKKAAARVVKKPGRILAMSGWKGWG